MYFDYSLYKISCFGIPVFGAVVFSIIIITHGAWLAYVAWRKQWDWRKNGLHLLGIISLGIVVCIEAGVLLKGGIYLCDEKEADAVEIQGEISNIKGLGLFSFPTVDCDYPLEEKKGYEFTVNGIQCIAIVKDSLEVGDYVTVKYLPKSGYILYIAEIDAIAADIE